MNGGRKRIGDCSKRTVRTVHGGRVDEEETALSLGVLSVRCRRSFFGIWREFVFRQFCGLSPSNVDKTTGRLDQIRRRVVLFSLLLYAKLEIPK